MKRIILPHKASKDLDQLTAKARFALLDALNEYALSGRGDVKKLSGRDGLCLRVGRWRALFDDDGVTIIAIYFGKRETATYKRN